MTALTRPCGPSSKRHGADRWCRRPFFDIADTLPQGGLKVDRAAVLFQQIGEGLVCDLLEVPHAVPGEQIEGIPGLLIELNALAGHYEYPAA
jgi:hypothetical protein